MAHTMIRGGRVLDIDRGTAEPADILVEDDTIREIGPPGLAAPEGATITSAERRLIHPGLVNAHTQAHGNFAKGMGDRWTLELLLTAAPWITGNRAPDDIHLTAQLGAVEMVLKGCTACYDLFLELPLPTRDGIARVAAAYQEVGMRAVIAPMVADRTFYEAIPGLRDALPEALRERVAALRLAPGASTLEAIRSAFNDLSLDRDRVRLAVAPTIPHHCSDEFILGCATLARDFDLGLHSHVAESKVQAIAGMRLYGKTLTGHLDELGVLGPQFTVAHGGWLHHDPPAAFGLSPPARYRSVCGGWAVGSKRRAGASPPPKPTTAGATPRSSRSSEAIAPASPAPPIVSTATAPARNRRIPDPGGRKSA